MYTGTHDILRKETTSSHIVELTECNWLLLGVTGAGKSCLGNFLLGREGTFKESDNILVSETKAASQVPALVNGRKICVIDTPGLGDTENLGKHDYKAKSIAEDASSIITELTKMTMMMSKGISAFLIVIPANVREHSGTLNLLDFMDILGNYWNHAILVLTHGKYLGKSPKDQEERFQSTVHSASSPPIWDKLLEKVNTRYVIVEAKEYRSDSAYTDSVVSKLLSFTAKIAQKHGPYHDDLHSIGNQALKNAKMQVRDKFPNLESHAAKEAIDRIACERVEDVVYNLIRIKMAGGKDVDQLEEIAKLKATEHQKLQEEADEIRQQYEEEQKRRKKAEEEKKKAEEKRIRADEARRIAEEREVEERIHRIKAEEKDEHTQKLFQNLENERDEAKQRSVNDRRQKEAAVKEKNAAEQKLLQEKYRREATEQSLIEEKRRRDSEEREKDAAKQEAREEKRRRENAEQKVHDERRLREIAERKTEAQKVVAQREPDGIQFAEFRSLRTTVARGNFAHSQELQVVRLKRSNN